MSHTTIGLPVSEPIHGLLINQNLNLNLNLNLRQARENACIQPALHVGFSFASHWLRKWREFCQPITERSKPKQTQITFDTLFADL